MASARELTAGLLAAILLLITYCTAPAAAQSSTTSTSSGSASSSLSTITASSSLSSASHSTTTVSSSHTTLNHTSTTSPTSTITLIPAIPATGTGSDPNDPQTTTASSLVNLFFLFLVLAVVAIGLAAWLFYTRRRKRTLASRSSRHDALARDVRAGDGFFGPVSAERWRDRGRWLVGFGARGGEDEDLPPYREADRKPPDYEEREQHTLGEGAAGDAGDASGERAPDV